LTSFIFDLPARGLLLEPVDTKTKVVAGRVQPALKARLEAIHARHLTSDSEVVERLVEAFCDYVEGLDAVRWPVRLEYDQEAAERVKQLVAEPPGNAYKTGSQKPRPRSGA
jgi:hypothetical protein